MQRVCGVTHTNGEISRDARLGQSLEVTIEPETDALFYDASDFFEVEDDLDTVVHDMSVVECAIVVIEHICARESQHSIKESIEWPSDCSGADSSVLQSFSSYMPLPSDADIFPGHLEDTQAFQC